MASEDKITTLPDDILLTILSLLTFKEAVATSILCRRWRYLWTSHPNLHIRYEDVVLKDDRDDVYLQQSGKVHGDYKDKCIQMVNQVLRGRKGQELLEFCIHYPLLKSSACHIDLWVAFAIAIGVSKLELNFSPFPYLIPISLNNNYLIPLDLFNKAKGIDPYLVQLEHAFSIPAFCLNVQNRFKSLRELILKFVDLTDEHFEAILSNWELEYPRENSLGLPYMQSKDFIFGQFAAHLSRLEYLMMDVGSFEGKQQFNKLPLFSNLKHLSLTCLNSSHGPCGMLRCYHTVVCFVEASPFLHRLELHFHIAPTTNPELRRIAIPPHRYLKEVLVSGFFGNELAKDIILSIFNFATELEKIEITTVCLYDLSKRPFKNWDADIEVVRRCMGQLHQRLPANAQLHFLDDRF
ncbi:hypothetical protein HRI_000222200 [Hibiscus trionum]|uniref:F-box domain-containing protein n=1 Tax=Hibiscus trionum TaxID=183268 RepID=A0A9W7GX52_HIBTR|nr:hypothetical protein HRI_000222200 [Hibiscus trionum]